MSSPVTVRGLDEGERPIHRMLGHPMLLQPPDPRDVDPELCLLLQVASTTRRAGRGATSPVCTSGSAVAAGRFDRAVLEPQSAWAAAGLTTTEGGL